ncbi:MAG TPA: polysaccharide biosynthesis tyrosine autokinase, partial [Rhizomicrobium sp.]|nr:polysaccharide biosynthesis tyrosine autokinase [Rhizomicrobium sp.]
DLTAVLSQMPTDPASLQNQIQILTSRELAGRVVDKLHLASDPEFAPHVADPALRHDGVIDVFLKHLSVDTIGLSTSLSIGFSSKDATKAARIANAVAQAYVEDQEDAEFDITRKTTQWLSDRVHGLAAELETAEEAVQRYKAENGINDTSANGSIADQQMTAVSAQLVEAQTNLAAKQAAYDRVTVLRRSGDVANGSQAATSPVITELRKQESDLIQQEAQLATRYGPRYPQMMQIESQKRDLENKINLEVGRVAEIVSNDLATAQAEVNSLQGNLAIAERRSAQQNLARVKLKALEADAASTQSEYEAFVSRLRETQSPQGDEIPDVRIISTAATPTSPSGPPRLLLVGAALPAGLLLGILLALIAERGGSSMPARAGRTRLPTTIKIPEPTGKNLAGLADLVTRDPNSPFAKAIEQLRRRVAPASSGRGARVVVVTSPVNGQGKTTVAVSLARSAARAGLKTILLDGNFRAPQVAQTIGAMPERGLLAALTGRLPLSQCFFRDPRSSAMVLACSQGLKNPTQLLNSPAISGLIQQLRGMSDLVVIDTMPVLSADDAQTLSHHADTVLVVARPRHTSRAAVDRATQSFADSEAELSTVSLAPAFMASVFG